MDGLVNIEREITWQNGQCGLQKHNPPVLDTAFSNKEMPFQVTR